MSPAEDLPVLTFETAAAFEAWMERHHEDAPGLWLQMAKKDAGVPSVTYAQALQVALCFGWIDGQRARGDPGSHRCRFTPRRSRSPWSQINRDHATALIESERMRPAGLAEIERARADGRWEAAYAGSRAAEVPEDLRRALESSPRALAEFEALDRRNRYAILYRVDEAKRPETRAARIARYVGMLAEGGRIHP